VQSAENRRSGRRTHTFLYYGEILKKARPALSNRILEKAGRLIIRPGFFDLPLGGGQIQSGLSILWGGVLAV